jgi:hypothetical protein
MKTTHVRLHPQASQLDAHMAFFNAPRIYMPSASDERVRNRTLPQGISRKAGRKAPAHHIAAAQTAATLLLSLNT